MFNDPVVVGPKCAERNSYVQVVDEGEFGNAWVGFQGNTPFGHWAKRTRPAMRTGARPGLAMYVDA